MKKIILTIVVLGVILTLWIVLSRTHRIDFTSEVKPILNRNCITCHGGVRQKGGFSVLFREEALARLKSGHYGIIPGDPEHSEMIRRLTLKDPEERMPYRHDALGKEEIHVLTEWIKQGALWGNHWAYVAVQEPALPTASGFLGLFRNRNDQAENGIDLFVADKLKEKDLKQSPEAPPVTLLRRLSLDIIGMPASASLAKRYLSHPSDEAYVNLVDSLLASPHYGEKWTSMWLDLARYADSKGYERDEMRSVWKYRDWLIHAFNEDKPYDQFLTEQIAGDLIPGATEQQFIATAFHRNTMTNDEGGTDNEEFRTAAVLDRVNTTWQVLMGTTFACVQCHSHPYDPFKHEDYYKFMAFFNDSRDEDTQADYPLYRSYNDSMQLQLRKVVDWVAANGSKEKAEEVNRFLRTWQPSYNSLTCDSFINSELSDTKWLALRDKAQCRLRHVDLNGKDQLIYRFQTQTPGGIWKIHLDSARGQTIATIHFDSTKDWEIHKENLAAQSGMHDLYFTYSNPKLKKPEDNGVLFDWFYFGRQLPGKEKTGYGDISSTYELLYKARVPTTPVMMDNPKDMHRPSFVFERGNWLVKGSPVEPGVPGSLNPMPAGQPQNRLGLAAWLTSKENPLTARTMVNRVWEQFFGSGLVETLEDMGSQGAAPNNPGLLDWLSYQFMYTDHWSMKKLIRRIVLSATYRQDSRLSKELLQKDPDNRYFARGPRVRLSSEQIRDQALVISGAFCDSMYGPSVFPWQPRGIWLTPWSGQTWEQSKNGQQYRRAVYTFWKRSSAYPSMLTFDGVSREVCTARRIRTNTPLQALTTLNDSAYVDLAGQFAHRMIREGGVNPKDQIQAGFQDATGHPADEKSLQILLDLYDRACHSFQNHVGKSEDITQGKINPPGFDALTLVASALLNLDEVLTKN